jgi:hypothetical protein
MTFNNKLAGKTGKLCLLLVVPVFILAAAGCGPAAQTPKDITGATVSPKEDTASPAATAPGGGQAVSVVEQLLLDQNGLKITAKGLENDPIWGLGVKLLLENSTDKNLGVGCNALIVNNYMISDLFSSSVAAGKKANDIMYISSSELSASGINKIGQIEVYFHIFDSDTFETLFDADPVTIKTSGYDTMDIKAMDDGKELYNQSGIRIVGKYVDEQSFWGAAVLLYIENSSGKNVGISCDNVSVNGFMVTPVFSSIVYNGKMAIDDITILSSDLEANGITSVDTIELTFRIYDADSYDTIADTEPITITT